MRVAFVLPGFDDAPVGGYRVVYEHSNRLVARGHDVDLLHPAVRGCAPRRRRALAQGVSAAWPLFAPAQRAATPTWFALDRRVRTRRLPRLRSSQLRGYDVVVATQWDTAEDVAAALPPGVGGAHLVQSWETWHGPEDRVVAALRLPLRKGAVARWLVDRLAELGEPATYVPNAVDISAFHADASVARVELRVAMLVHPDYVKGSDVGLAALDLARRRLPALTVTAYGAYPRPGSLGSWVEYTRRPTPEQLRALLSSAEVFLSPSRVEGAALPPLEAMACGCAVVATDIGGHRDYARHPGSGEAAAVLVPSDDPGAAADAVVRLLQERGTLRNVAAAGLDLVSTQLNWEQSATALEAVLSLAADDATASAAPGAPPAPPPR